MITENALLIVLDTKDDTGASYYILADSKNVSDEAITDLFDIDENEFIFVDDITNLPVTITRVVEYIY